MEWEEVLKKFIKEYSNQFTSCIMVGSLVYGSEFRKDSDIDLIICYNKISEWEKAVDIFMNNEEFKKKSLDIYNKEAEYFCIKFIYQGIDFSVDFVSTEFTELILEKIDDKKTIVYNKITNKKQTNHYLFGSGDSKLEVKKENLLFPPCVTVSSPLHVINEDKYYWGILLDKLITGYTQCWGENSIWGKICLKAIQRMKSQKNVKDLRTALHSLNRFKRLPEEYIKILEKKYES